MVSFKEFSQRNSDQEDEKIEVRIFGINPIPYQPSSSKPNNSLKLEELMCQ